MRVVGRGGETIGGVEEVVVDQESGILVGVAVRPDLFSPALLVPGGQVQRLHEGVLYVDASAAELHPYETPVERRHATEQEYRPA